MILQAFFIYFILGLARDFMGTLFYRSVSRGRRFSASTLSGALTLLDILVISIVIRGDAPILAVAYAAGCGAGTFMAMWKGKK